MSPTDYARPLIVVCTLLISGCALGYHRWQHPEKDSEALVRDKQVCLVEGARFGPFTLKTGVDSQKEDDCLKARGWNKITFP